LQDRAKPRKIEIELLELNVLLCSIIMQQYTYDTQGQFCYFNPASRSPSPVRYPAVDGIYASSAYIVFAQSSQIHKNHRQNVPTSHMKYVAENVAKFAFSFKISAH